MSISRSKKALVLVTAFVIVGATAAIAIPAVISQQTINDATSTHFRVVKTVADGFDSGWHVHPGVAIVQVQQGSVQIYQGSCTPKTVAAGETYIEIPHEAVRGVATGRAIWTTTLLTNQDDLPTIPLSAYAPERATPCPGT